MEPESTLSGKVALVTGANKGIGYQTALGLAARGATLICVARDRGRGEAAVAAIKEGSKNPDVTLMLADLSVQRSIRELVDEVHARHERLHILVNNAGVIIPERRVTVDGLENTFALNHLGYFLLTNLLIDLLRAGAPARIVNVASEAERLGKRLDFDDLQLERTPYGAYRAYGRSKLANIVFTYELARRLEGSGVTVNALHPGTVRTGFGSEFSGVMGALMKVARPFLRSPERGADTAIYLATSPEVEGKTGLYWFDRKPIRSLPVTYDESVQGQLWSASEKLTGLGERNAG